jgi:hypothetical protein
VQEAEGQGGDEGEAAESHSARGVDGVKCRAEARPASAQVGTLAAEGSRIVRGVGCIVVDSYDWHFGGDGWRLKGELRFCGRESGLRERGFFAGRMCRVGDYAVAVGCP